jgi:hypothetical protein
MFKLEKSGEIISLERKTFKSLGFKEGKIERLIKDNIGIFTKEEESLLVVGQQVINESKGRSDLVAIDGEGNLVLIEIKRDKKDIETRSEPFEIQAIRYAANLANIKTPEELANQIFSRYIEKNIIEFKDELTNDISFNELALIKINNYLKSNASQTTFNLKQKVILIASEFDLQTLSAVAWLNKNKVDISCYSVEPYKNGKDILLKLNKLLPLKSYEEFYVNVLNNREIKHSEKSSMRENLPRIEALIRWKILNPGDKIVARDYPSETVILDQNGNVKNKSNKVVSLQKWLRSIYKWSAVHTYVYAIHKETGKSLDELRENFMNSKEYEKFKNDW